MQIVRRRIDSQSLLSSQVGLLVGVFVGHMFLRDTHRIAHFWPITILLVLVFEASLLFRWERK